MTQRFKFVLGRIENIVGKGEKCWLPAFSPFPTMFSKAFFSRVVKSRDYIYMVLLQIFTIWKSPDLVNYYEFNL